MNPKTEVVDRHVVHANKKCLLYMLFDWVFPYRGKWQEHEAQKQALDAFLSSHSPPPRTMKVNGQTVDGGNYSVPSLWDVIRTGVMQQGRTDTIKRSPVNSFFQYGHEAVRLEYYQQALKVYQERFPHESVTDHYAPRPSNAVMSEFEQTHQENAAMLSTTPSVASGLEDKQKQPDRCKETRGNELKQGAGTLLKERFGLSSTLINSHAHDGPRKRSRPDKLGSSCQHIERPKKKPKRLPRPAANVAPPSTRDILPSIDAEYLHENLASENIHPRKDAEGLSLSNKIGASHGPPIVRTSAINKYMQEMDHCLWNDLRKTLDSSGLGWAGPVEFHDHPSSGLEGLYRTCLGNDWKKAGSTLSTREQITSLDFLIILLGAAIHTYIFSTNQDWERTALMTFRSQYHEDEALRVFQAQDPHDWDVIQRTIALRTARNERYRDDVLRPAARLKAFAAGKEAYNHLTYQFRRSGIRHDGDLARSFDGAVSSAFEKAMLLKAELGASGMEIQPTWFGPGSTFDDTRMRLSGNVVPTETDGRKIETTWLSGVNLRQPGAEWTVLVPALVYVSRQA